MALHVRSSFSAGELDPVLRERTTLEKYKSGLATARNVIVGRSGDIISRVGRKTLFETKTDDSPVKLYAPPRTDYMLEVGVGYIRIYNTLTNVLIADLPFTSGDSQIEALDFEFMKFTTSRNFVYIFTAGKILKKIDYVAGTNVTLSDAFILQPPPTLNSLHKDGSPSGNIVEYGFSYVKNREESQFAEVDVTAFGFAPMKLPIATGQSNTFFVFVGRTVDIDQYDELRCYRRPVKGSGYGFMGNTTRFDDFSGTLYATIIDLGQASDFAHTPPDLIANGATMKPTAGIIYQQRLILSDSDEPEAVFATRTGHQNNLTTSHPISDDSALNFKSGSSGTAEVIDFIESDGIVVFTTAGVFINVGSLIPTNLSLTRKGKWIIDRRLQPLAVPSGVFFVDVSTNSVRSLIWSTELGGYTADDMSIYSNHFFKKNLITSWAFQEGVLPVLWVTFADGTFASFTYQYEQQMRAWTRHDSSAAITVEQVCETGNAEKTYFLVKKGTKRYVEITNPRYVSAAAILADTQADKNVSIAAMDSIRTYDGRLPAFPYIGDDSPFAMVPVVAGDWLGLITLTCGAHGTFTNPGPGTVGKILRFFNPDDQTEVDFQVMARTSNNSITVQVVNGVAVPANLADFANIYLCTQQITGLTDLEGEAVGVIGDGYILSSPNNNYVDDETPATLTVSGGIINLPRPSAIVHIGRVFVADTETLDIDSVEQKPTVIETSTVNKLYIKTNDSRGLYIGNRFTDNDKVATMEKLDKYVVDDVTPVVGNRYDAPKSRRTEVTLPGDWKSNGRVCVRQVDPLHFELLSIISDIEVTWRSDR